ncbi:hypothetical protein ACN9KI_08925 [Aliarcobacter butzleri]|uniref:hypothetical protein n=1 Tax=Aliarcobacter butzleri TaxID=28197 RepID=UPI003B228437
MKEKIYKLAGKLRTAYQKKINDTYIWTSIASSAIYDASNNDDFLSKESIKVPTNQLKVKEVKRTKEDLSKILISATSNDFNHAILTFLVAQVEAFFYDLICGVLLIDKRRLKIKIDGINHIKTINVDDILNAETLDTIIEDLVNKELISIFYASPEKQLEYMNKILGIKFDDKIELLFNKWKEFKASRDIIVHNSGIINDTYIKKSGIFARGNIDSTLVIDEKYLHSLIAESKSLIGILCTTLQRHNKS